MQPDTKTSYEVALEKAFQYLTAPNPRARSSEYVSNMYIFVVIVDAVLFVGGGYLSINVLETLKQHRDSVVCSNPCGCNSNNNVSSYPYSEPTTPFAYLVSSPRQRW